MMELSKFPLDEQVCTMEIASCEYYQCVHMNVRGYARSPLENGGKVGGQTQPPTPLLNATWPSLRAWGMLLGIE